MASDESQPEWISLAAASRLMGVYPGAIKSLALSGSIRFRTIMGRVRYCRADVEQVRAGVYDLAGR